MRAVGLSPPKLIKFLAAFAAISVLVSGCGDGSDGDGEGTGSGGSDGPGGGGAITLRISGSPPSEIVAETTFRFTPTVDNPDDVALTFTAMNLPRWATLNPSTGEVTGTPGAGDVGSYSGIRITVSGGGASASTPFFSVEVVAFAPGSATVSWQPPTQNEDGSLLLDLAGYRIYFGGSPDELTRVVTVSNPGLTRYVVENLTPGTWYFGATAYDQTGTESRLSNLVSKTIL